MSEIFHTWLRQAPTYPPVVARLAELLRCFGEHDAAGSQLALLILTFLWQETRSNRPGPTPSLLLADLSSPEPLTGSLKLLEVLPGKSVNSLAPPCYRFGPDREDTDSFLEMILKKMKNRPPVDERMIASWEQRREFSYGPCASRATYAGRTLPKLGVLTGPDMFRPFTAIAPDAIREFLRDIASSRNPFQPLGFTGGRMLVKDCPLVGVLSVKALAPDWLGRLIHLQTPVFVAPFSVPTKLTMTYKEDVNELLSMLSAALRYGHFPCVRQGYELNAEIKAYIPFLRRRLRFLPDDFEYATLSTIRGLDTVAIALAEWLAAQSKNMAWALVLKDSLLAHAVRGLTLAIETLAFYGVGIDFPGIQEKQWRKALEALRTQGPMHGRDLLRRVTVVDADARDKILAILIREGLVEQQGKEFRALSLVEFLASMIKRSGFPARPSIPVWEEPRLRGRVDENQRFSPGRRVVF